MTSPTFVDTSVWVEFLRGTDGPATSFVRDHIGIDLATSEPILMELLAGAATGRQTERAERLLLGQHWLRVEPALDYRGAVQVFQAARATGHQPRSLQDCLVSAVALRCQVAVAHRDADYERIAAATGLATIDLR